MAFFSMFLDVIASCFMWFTQVMTAAGLLDIFTGLIVISLVFWRILSPMLRSTGSDRARRTSRKDSSNE